MSPADRIQKALKQSVNDSERQLAVTALAQTKRRQEIRRITEEHPADRGFPDRITSKHRIMAALIAFGKISHSEANQELRVADAIGNRPWGFESIGEELINAGLPVVLSKRPSRNGNLEFWLELRE